VGRLVISVLILVTATFFMVQAIPGNPVAETLGQQATRQLVQLRTRQLGLDKPLLLAAPAHPYTAALLAATPDIAREPDQSMPTIDGRVPGPEENLPGCYFASRCPAATDRCRAERPSLRALGGRQSVACWYPLAGDGRPPSLTGAEFPGTAG
jgi:oligopeptide/dipeptide ABC transporter ATP-binding protein